LRGHGEPPRFFTASSLAALGVAHATTTRHCGAIGPSSGVTTPFGTAVVEALAPAGLDLGRAAWARQVHGADVARVEAGGFAGNADVLVTTTPRVPLAIFTADCLAIVLVDVDAPALAVAHVGWRGTVRGATRAAVGAVIAAGGSAERVRAFIAPSIGPCCYEVDAPVTDALASAHPGGWRGWVTPGADAGHVMLDLWAANTALLQQAGVRADHIDVARVCTACHVDTLYSYRKGHNGRLATVAAL
jgi:polyphenol oxidase